MHDNDNDNDLREPYLHFNIEKNLSNDRQWLGNNFNEGGQTKPIDSSIIKRNNTRIWSFPYPNPEYTTKSRPENPQRNSENIDILTVDIYILPQEE